MMIEFTESKPKSLMELLQKSEFEAWKAGKGKLWILAYERERRTHGVLASLTKANILMGIVSELQQPDPDTVVAIRIALTDRKIRQLTGQPEYAA